jgi:hypothetical protein
MWQFCQHSVSIYIILLCTYLHLFASATNIPCGKSFIPCVINDSRKFLKVVGDNYSVNRKSLFGVPIASESQSASLSSVKLIINAPSIPTLMLASAVNEAKSKVDNLIRNSETTLVNTCECYGLIIYRVFQKLHSNVKFA